VTGSVPVRIAVRLAAPGLPGVGWAALPLV